jgi:hypothetical protein
MLTDADCSGTWCSDELGVEPVDVVVSELLLWWETAWDMLFTKSSFSFFNAMTSLNISNKQDVTYEGGGPKRCDGERVQVLLDLDKLRGGGKSGRRLGASFEHLCTRERGRPLSFLLVPSSDMSNSSSFTQWRLFPSLVTFLAFAESIREHRVASLDIFVLVSFFS